LELLPRHAYVVNVGRAEIIGEQALYDALVSGSIAGAAIDVWYRYPAPGENGYGSRLPFHTLPNVICTPHYSAWTRPMILRRIDRMSGNLRRLVSGEPLQRVVLRGQ
jgi:phosphoglycerate dehydrogenase-like enzyme